MTLSLREPKIYLDVSKAGMLSKLTSTAEKKDTKPTEGHSKRVVQNVPRGSFSVCIDRPSIHIKCATTRHTGIISWSGITLEANGSYCAQKNRPASVLPRFSEPQHTSAVQQRTQQTQSRPSWINLFRRSWKSKGPSESSDDKKAIEWYYKTSMRFTVQNTCFDMLSENAPSPPKNHTPSDVGDPNNFVSVGNFECNAHTRLPVSFAHDVDRQNTRVIWNPDAHHINVDTVVDRPVLNLWTRTLDGQHQMEFWARNVVEQVSEQVKQQQQPQSPPETTPSDHSALFGYMSILKTSVVIADAAIVLEGVDHGLKGKRTIPTGYLDNAPEKDVDVRVIASIQQISLVFTGSRVFHKTHKGSLSQASTSTENDDTESQHMPFGTSRFSIQHFIIERIFKSDHTEVDEHDWHQHEDRKAVIMWISRINTRTQVLLDSAHRILLVPSIVVKKNGAQYSITNHYACLVTAMSTLAALKQVFPSSKSSKPHSHPSKQSRVVLHKLQFQINRTDVHIFLPGGTTELYLRMDTLRMAWDNQVEHHGDMPPMAIRNITLFGVAPKQADHWDQLFELDNMRFSMEKDVDFSTGQLTKTHQLTLSKMYMRIPYGYELCNFVDSTVTLIKAIKATHARVSKGVSFLYFGPHEKHTPTVIPHMRLVCDLFTFQFEDDPFEARLCSIYKTGILEQANRIAIQDAFEMKAQTLMQPSGDDKASEDADARVNEAWQKLQQHNSNSWRRHIDAALSKQHATYVRIQSANYRHTMLHGQLDDVFDDPVTDEKTHYLSDMFSIHIVDLPKYPPLLDLTIKHTSLDFRHPDFDLDQTRQFIFDVGKGQPLDTPLSTMLPFHLDWKSGETWAQLRDYPIPFISVPPLASSPQDNDISTLDDVPHATAAWTLSGNYVFGDDLGDLDATRSIHLTVVDENDAHYAMDIVRTTTPLKFFSIVNIDVHNSALSHICWCVPYQPAIQDITRVMDTFTKPPVDPSQKVGFWDKIRLIIHTRVKISFVGGGDLAMVMKGSRDPYDMSEKGFGLAKVWRNDVVWLLGHQNPQGEFMQIISRDYAFGVPDLVRGGYTAPYIIAADHSGCKDTQQQQQQQQEMRQSISMSSFNSSIMSSSEENGSRFVKIALKLSGGIRMGLGCHLERMCHPRCDICDENSDVMPDARAVHKSRLLHFLPHYKVKLKAPQNVHEENYDAYRGFRSDFIHTSISIIKTSDYEPTDASDKVNVTGNSMHLTPGFIDHFVSWFRLFGGAMSYPLRAGSLFPKLDTRPTQKFGRHMSTMKYKVVVNPLTCGYFMKDENVVAQEVTTEELGDSVGLKGFVKAFSVDIHQRREIVNVANYKLDQKRLKANWPVTEAEVQLKNIDLRAVKASYNINGNDDAFSSSSGTDNISVPVQAEQYMSDESDDGLDMMEGLNYRCNKDSDSSDWVDLDDFIEMGVATPDILPAIQVLPFAFSPCIYYLRQTNKDDVQKFRYLHDTHDCILGTAVDTREMQMTLLHDRSQHIDVQIRKHQTRLHTIELKRLQHGSDEKALQELSDAIVEKTRILYEKRELLQRYLKELSTQDLPDVVHNKKSDAYSQSTIFGKDSLAQWEELMGYFKVRYIAHNPQILWNNSVRNILYHGLDLKDHRRALSYYMTARTVKFLRDLIEASDMQYSHSHKPFVLDDDDGGMDTSMAEELIAKLLSEQDTKFYAPNETEEEKPLDGSDSDTVDMSKSDNVNNPLMQLKTIPNNYVMKSSYLVDLLNPQISLQSDCDPDNIVLVANERTQVKGFNIIDETDPDVEMEMVKHRTVVSLDNVQFFVAKKEQFDSVDLLLDNHYGAKESDHWLAWIPPEMLISYVKRSDKFQRIGDRIAATLQYDKYNPLRIKTSTNAYAHVHPFEDRCDSVQLNFPSLKLTADSSQYNAIYQVATDLLLYKEPAKKERLARLREIMMAADRSSLYEATEKIVGLQSRARQLLHARDQYRQNMALLDDTRIEEFKSIRLTLYDTLEELYLGMEAIKLMQSNQRKDYHEPKTNLKFVFCAEKMEWEMLSKGEVPLCECALTNFTFNFVSKEDHSSINTLEVDILQVKNLSPSPVFVDVLGPYFDSRKPYDFSRHKMLRCYFVSLAPVGGIPVIQHLEINLHPMRVQMTYSFGRQLAFYLFPPEKQASNSNNKQLESEAPVMAPSTSAPTTTTTTVSNNNNNASTTLDASDSTTTTTMEQSSSSSAIIIPQPSSSERSDQASSRHHASSSVASAPVGSSANLSASFDSQKLSNSSQLFMSSSSRDDVEETPNDSPSSSTLLPVPQSTSSNSNKKAKKQQNTNKLSKFKTPDDLSVMKKRASSNRAFILVKIPGARHCLSYQGPKEKNIEDLRDFAFEQPTLEFRNETWSWFELMSNIKKDFMRAALLHNSTALLKEKLLRRHPRDNAKLIDSSVSMYTTPIYVTDHAATVKGKQPYDVVVVTGGAEEEEDQSESSSVEDVLDPRDIASLHSAHSNEIWDTAQVTPPSQPQSSSSRSSKKTHLWQKLKKSKKGSSSERHSVASGGGAGHDSVDVSPVDSHPATTASSSASASPALARSISASTRHLNEDDQLTVKGRYLLGKYYNGPTQWLAPGAKLKGKQQINKKA
ncbi:golgi-body localization protein domain-containing protein [Mucor lusitanicus]|uniref:Golgi-body localization protein domain-containing protein n=1 Tax=Mucor circinelloides f. lusitanicus TaxID=29924 RepID=A0A8H4F0A6_MUCCL|nr:golgi-body localization protein domain-containing protein [Mucor lusitanicus]